VGSRHRQAFGLTNTYSTPRLFGRPLIGRRRPKEEVVNEAIERFDQLNNAVVQSLKKAKRHPILLKTLNRAVAREVDAHRTSGVASVLEKLVNDGLVLVLKDDEYFWAENLVHLKRKLYSILESFHARYPFEPGIRSGDIKKEFSAARTKNARKNIDPRLFETVMSACIKDGLVAEAALGVRLSNFLPQSKDDPEIEALEKRILDIVSAGQSRRFGLETLSKQIRSNTRKTKTIVSEMVRGGRLIRIKDNRYLDPERLERIKRTLVVAFETKSRLQIGEIVALLGQSRTATIPLMEYLDRVRFTRRIGNCRELIVVKRP
jgi:selenocysteine-specific elongation factor